MQKIEEDERRYENEVAAFRSGDIRAKEGATMKHEKIKNREQENQRYQSDQTRQNVESSRRGARVGSTNQSGNRSRSSGEQEPSTAMGNTEEADAKRWGHPRESDTDEQETTRATAQGSTDESEAKQRWGHARDIDTTNRTETKTTRTIERSTASESTNDAQTEKEQFMNGRSRNPENSPYGQIGTRSADAETGTAKATKHDTEEEDEGQDIGQPSRRRK